MSLAFRRSWGFRKKCKNRHLYSRKTRLYSKAKVLSALRSTCLSIPYVHRDKEDLCLPLRLIWNWQKSMAEGKGNVHLLVPGLKDRGEQWSREAFPLSSDMEVGRHTGGALTFSLCLCLWQAFTSELLHTNLDATWTQQNTHLKPWYLALIIYLWLLCGVDRIKK